MTLEDQLRRDEGCKGSAYQDSRGYWTIGIGTCIDARANCGLTNEEISLLFKNRMMLAQTSLEFDFPWTAALDEVRLGALENMTFQMGIRHLAEFKEMFKALQAGDYQGAHDAALDSPWAQVQSPARAKRLATQLLNGVWQ